MDPICRDGEDESIIYDMIQQDTQREGSFQEDAPEDDGSQYLNDTGDGDADHPKINDCGRCWSWGIWNSDTYV